VEDAHERLSGQDLTGRSFAGEDLRDWVLEDCTLVGVNFRGADLAGVTFRRCNAFDPDGDACADFSYANLREAVFSRCDLTGAEFGRVRGYELSFEHCQLGGVSLAGADFRLPIGTGAELAAFTMTACNFAYGDLSNTWLKACVLTDNRMIEVLLDNTVLDEATLTGSDLTNARGRGLSLKGADLRGARIGGLDPRRIDLTGARITPEQALSLLEPLGVVVEPGD